MKTAWVAGLILLALVARVIPHPENFTPVMAVALFAGACLPARIAFIVPLVAIALSDLVLGHAFDLMTIVIYGSLLLGVLLGRVLQTKRTLTRTAGAAVASSVIFFVLTNFAVWALPEGHALYPQTLQGLIDCYVMAIPFFRNELFGTLFWSAALFGALGLAQTRINSLGAHGTAH